MFPRDFDGIVAGSPAVDFNNLQSWRANFFIITGPSNSSNFISKSTWTGLIHDEVLNQCDGIDGAVDGIIEDPSLCNFNPETLLCQPRSSANCLSSSQVEILRRIFSPLFDETGSLIYPAMQPGSEIMAVEKLYAGAPFSYSEVSSPLLLFPSSYILVPRNGSNTSSTPPSGPHPHSISKTPPKPKLSTPQTSAHGPPTCLSSKTQAVR